VLKKLRTVNNTTGQTSKHKPKMSIDQKDSQAYCNCESDVNNTKGVVSKPKINGFPQRVEKWIWPAQGRIELSNSNGQTTQTGVDIYSNQGSEVVAAASGKVVYAGNALRGYGNLIIIKHTESFLSAYAHSDRILVSEREWVSAGQEIAKMGDTGTTRVKLHFEIRYRGKAVEPMKYLPNKQ
jgi:lipoprotein NlpD